MIEGNLVGKTRRCKSMQAALAGVQMVTPAWISECLTCERIILPSVTSVIRSLPTTAAESNATSFGVAKLAAAKLGNDNNQLFRDVNVFLCSSFESKQGRDISTLLRAGSAGILSNVASVKKCLSHAQKVVCLCGSKSKTKISQAMEEAIRAHSDRVLVCDFKWLFDSISSGSICDMDEYQPEDAKAMELWRLAMQHRK